MYLGVSTIVTLRGENNNRIAIVKSLTEEGKAVEYAVKMKRIAPEYRMNRLLADHKVSAAKYSEILSIIIKFHSTALTNPAMQRYGLQSIRQGKGLIFSRYESIEPKKSKFLKEVDAHLLLAERYIQYF